MTNKTTRQQAAQLTGLTLTKAQEDKMVSLMINKGQSIIDFLKSYGTAADGESFDGFMKRAGAAYKAMRATEKANYKPTPQQKTRGYYTNADGVDCREYIGHRGEVVHEVVQGHIYELR